MRDDKVQVKSHYSSSAPLLVLIKNACYISSSEGTDRQKDAQDVFTKGFNMSVKFIIKLHNLPLPTLVLFDGNRCLRPTIEAGLCLILPTLPPVA